MATMPFLKCLCHACSYMANRNYSTLRRKNIRKLRGKNKLFDNIKMAFPYFLHDVPFSHIQSHIVRLHCTLLKALYFQVLFVAPSHNDRI